MHSGLLHRIRWLYTRLNAGVSNKGEEDGGQVGTAGQPAGGRVNEGPGS